MNLKDKRVLITGGYGFLGKAVFSLLSKHYKEVVRFTLEECDLSREEEVKALFEKHRPDIVIHCASVLGGLDYVKNNCGEIYYLNSLINLYVTEYCRRYQVEKLVSVGSASVYAPDCSIPYREEDIWDGQPEESIRGYAFTKKSQIIHQEMYKKQYRLDSVHLILANLYGPGYDFSVPHPHVIPSMIKKIHRARQMGEPQVTFWGSGNQSREFLYEEDAARAILNSIENLHTTEPVNVGSEEEIPLKELSSQIQEILGYEGEILWDLEKPEGSTRRKLSLNKGENLWNYKAEMPFEKGLKETVKGFLSGGKNG